jgi:hypothetical protein
VISHTSLSAYDCHGPFAQSVFQVICHRNHPSWPDCGPRAMFQTESSCWRLSQMDASGSQFRRKTPSSDTNEDVGPSCHRPAVTPQGDWGVARSACCVYSLTSLVAGCLPLPWSQSKHFCLLWALFGICCSSPKWAAVFRKLFSLPPILQIWWACFQCCINLFQLNIFHI